MADSYIIFFDNFILLGFYARDIWSFVLCRIIWQVFGGGCGGGHVGGRGYYVELPPFARPPGIHFPNGPISLSTGD